MLARRLGLIFKRVPQSQASSSATPLNEERSKSWGRKAVSFVLFAVSGGVALSALDDLAIYHGCSSKAIEKASNNQTVIDSIGEPLVKGPWYNASLAVAHKRQSVSCTFPVSGPQGTGIFRLKAVRNEDTWLSFLRPANWDILMMDALLHTPANEGKQQTTRVDFTGFPASPSASSISCSDCRIPESESPERK